MIHFHCSGQIRAALGRGDLALDLGPPVTVAEAIRRLGDQVAPELRGQILESGGPARSLLIFLDGVQIQDTSILVADGQEITILSPIAGG